MSPANTPKSQLNPSRGLKRPPEGLEEWIRLANLVPHGFVAPEIEWEKGQAEQAWPSLLEWIAKLPEALRSELLAYEHYPKTGHSVIRAAMVFSYYDKIRVASTYLGALTKPNPEQTQDYMESLMNTLHYADLSYLRRCGYCDKIFYASKSGQSTQRGCTPRHSANIRNKELRERKEGEKRKEEEQKAKRSERDKRARIARKELEEGKKRAKKRASKSGTRTR